MLKLLIILLSLSLCFCQDITSEDFDYDEQGDDWTNYYCTYGENQSPIDVPAMEDLDESSLDLKLQYDYEPYVDQSVFLFVDRYISLAGAAGIARITNLLGDGITTDYALGGLHFHTGSEHLFDGKRMAIEMHVGHHTEDPEPSDLVFSVFFDSDLDEESPFLNLLNIDDLEPFTLELDQFLLSLDQQVYYYLGSHTIPDCLEICHYIMFKPLPCTRAQVEQLTAYVNNNYRNVQPINDMVVEYLTLDASTVKNTKK